MRLTAHLATRQKIQAIFLNQVKALGARVKTSYQTAYERFATNVAVCKVNDKLQFMGIAKSSEDGDRISQIRKQHAQAA
ncbi:hypothetical protein OH492_05360 [Vibrio chagasii]|nr:hypothetical protein [Vibrio chagasii]